MPKFYGYEKIICAELKKRFDYISVIYENRDWVSFWHRFVYVYLPQKKRKILDDFYFREINKLPNDIDTVLVIRGSSLSPKVMKYMKKTFAGTCRFIMYQWDGTKNNTDILDVINYFDEIFTFDIEDAKAYGWKYRPLFFDSTKVKKESKSIDVSFLCSLHSQRAEILSKLKILCEQKNLCLFHNMYCNRWIYLKWKYVGKKTEYKDTNDNDVSFKSLSLDETYDVYSKSKIIVDYTHPNQTGFTMRTIESLGSMCKLVTNNKMILQADFYNPSNIFVYEGTQIEIPDSFINKAYENLTDDLYYYYSIDGWMDTILGNI